MFGHFLGGTVKNHPVLVTTGWIWATSARSSGTSTAAGYRPTWEKKSAANNGGRLRSLSRQQRAEIERNMKWQVKYKYIVQTAESKNRTKYEMLNASGRKSFKYRCILACMHIVVVVVVLKSTLLWFTFFASCFALLKIYSFLFHCDQHWVSSQSLVQYRCCWDGYYWISFVDQTFSASLFLVTIIQTKLPLILEKRTKREATILNNGNAFYCLIKIVMAEALESNQERN